MHTNTVVSNTPTEAESEVAFVSKRARLDTSSVTMVSNTSISSSGSVPSNEQEFTFQANLSAVPSIAISATSPFQLPVEPANASVEVLMQEPASPLGQSESKYDPVPVFTVARAHKAAHSFSFS